MDLRIALEGFFFEKVNGSMDQWVTFSDTILYMIADDTRLTPHRCKKHTAYDSRQHQAEATLLQKVHGVFCSLDEYMYLLVCSNWFWGIFNIQIRSERGHKFM